MALFLLQENGVQRLFRMLIPERLGNVQEVGLLRVARRWLVGGVVLAAILVSSCGYRSEEFRYRMTVEVETPQGLRTGSSVIEVEVSDPGPNSLPEAGTSARVRGEAVAVDLPGGKVLFALLRSPDNVDGAAVYPYEALKPSRYRGEYALIERTKELKQMRRAGALRRDAYPILVTFGDLNDPSSVERVDPADLAATFGEGFSLKRITVQITSEPLTIGLDKKLPTPGARGFFNWDGKSNPNKNDVFGIWDFIKGS